MCQGACEGVSQHSMCQQVVHTSQDIFGQIFIPEINYFIMLMAVAVVVGFQDSVHLGNAYGTFPSQNLLQGLGYRYWCLGLDPDFWPRNRVICELLMYLGR